MTSIFIQIMGDSPSVRVIDYLLTERDLDFSISDLSRNVSLGRTTLYKVWDSFLKYNIVVHTRFIGNSKLYKLNKENFIVKKLIEIDDNLIKKELKNKIKLKQIV
jgi:DNA-binding transcriptional ArsR family regulator